jgi:predicted nucleotidyltransferase
MSSSVKPRIQIPLERLSDICRRYHVTELSLFGSVLRDDFGPDSDVDMLVVFDPAAGIGLFELVAMQEELSALFGRAVDLLSKRGLHPVIRDDVLASSEVIYAA